MPTYPIAFPLSYRRKYRPSYRNIRLMLSAAGLCVAIAATAGCGGGSGTSRKSKAIIRERAIASARLTRGVFAIAGIGRKITRVPKAARPRLRWILAAVQHSRDAAPDFDPDLGLYFVSQTDLDGSGHQDLFSDASHNVPAGEFVWRAPAWANDQKDSYPATIHTDYHIDGGQFAGEQGTIDFVADDPSGENGKMHVVMITRLNERVDADFDVVNGVVRGREKCSLPDDTTWIELDVPQDDGGWLTTIVFDDGSTETLDTAPDGSINETLKDPDGNIDVSGVLDPEGVDDLTFDDGSQETIDVDLGDNGNSGDSGSSNSDDRKARRAASIAGRRAVPIQKRGR